MQKLTCLAALGCALLFGQSVLANEEALTSLDQILVTGARTPLNVNQVGSALTVISRDDIERREARYVTDLLRTVPGFSVSHSGVAGSQTQVRVRGAEANHVLVLIDGVRANDPATGDEFRWEYLNTGNIERIEIVRGPQSSLWGSDAVAAVIHIITRSAQPDSGASAYLESGSFSTTNAGLNGVINGRGWSLQGGIESLATDGSNISRSGAENDDSDMIGVNVTANVAATDTLSLNAGFRSVDAYSQFDPVDFFVTGLPTDGDIATNTSNFYGHAGAIFKPDGSRVTHHLTARHFDSDNQNLSDGVESASTAAGRLSFGYQADIGIGGNVLSLALEHEETEFEQRGAIMFGDPNQKQSMTVTSAIAEFQRHASEKLTWILGARADDNSDFDDAINGRLSVTYQVSEKTLLRASAGTGQKNPTFTDRFGFFPGQFAGNPSLKPERSTSYEIGADRKFADGALLLQTTIFQQDLEDEINGFVFDPVTFLSTAENMSGKSKRSGVELAAQWNVSETIHVAAHYTYTDATEQDFLGVDVGELRRPRHSGGMSLEYQALSERFAASLNADYGGTRTDIFFPPFPTPSEIVTLDNFWLVDATLKYRASDTMTVFAKGSNLLDTEYEQVFGYRTSGRAGFLGVRIAFGQ